MPTYQTQKYIVSVNKILKQVDIYNTREELIQILKKFKKVWIGDNLSPSLKQPIKMPIGAHYEPKGKFPGNTILVQIAINKYVFIGERIQEFKLPDDETVVKYVSPFSQGEYSMPYIIGKRHVYFLDSNSIPYLPKDLFNLKWDAYTQRWEHNDNIKRLLKVKKHVKIPVNNISQAERREKIKLFFSKRSRKR